MVIRIVTITYFKRIGTHIVLKQIDWKSDLIFLAGHLKPTLLTNRDNVAGQYKPFGVMQFIISARTRTHVLVNKYDDNDVIYEAVECGVLQYFR